MKIKSGGGYSSNKTVHSQGYKTEPKARTGNVAGVAQQGLATAFKKEPITSGRGYEPGPMPKTGSRGEFNAAATGPGSGRTIYKHGTQTANPPATGMPAGRDILSEYGRDVPGKGRR
jgi:hypothetical protein